MEPAAFKFGRTNKPTRSWSLRPSSHPPAKNRIPKPHPPPAGPPHPEAWIASSSSCMCMKHWEVQACSHSNLAHLPAVTLATPSLHHQPAWLPRSSRCWQTFRLIELHETSDNPSPQHPLHRTWPQTCPTIRNPHAVATGVAQQLNHHVPVFTHKL